MKKRTVATYEKRQNSNTDVPCLEMLQRATEMRKWLSCEGSLSKATEEASAGTIQGKTR